MADVSKASIRDKVWRQLDQEDLVNFPRPCRYRIPNFKGASEAAQRLAALSVFQKAITVKVNPDKPQEDVRFFALEQHKQLLVPTPRLRSGLFNLIEVPSPAAEGGIVGKNQLRICSSSRGVREFSKPVGLEANTKVQLVVIGAVAVSRTGIRIGKGEGYADLEFAIMQGMGAVDENTQVVVTVHDEQVMDLPETLVAPHDIPVDLIVTPTRVLEVSPRPARPFGILWSLLTRRKFREIPVLAKLREQDVASGRDVRLKEDVLGMPENENLEEEKRKRPSRFRSRGVRRPAGPYGDTVVVTDGEKSAEDAPARRRRQGRDHRERRGAQKTRENEGDVATDGTVTEEPAEDVDAAVLRRRRRPRRNLSGKENAEKCDLPSNEEKALKKVTSSRRRKIRREHDESKGTPIRRTGAMPALYVSSLPRRGLRVSQFKAALRETHDVHPLRVTWGGGDGRAFLIFRELDEMHAALKALSELTLMERKANVEITRRTREAFNLNDGGDESPVSTAAAAASASPPKFGVNEE